MLLEFKVKDAAETNDHVQKLRTDGDVYTQEGIDPQQHFLFVLAQLPEIWLRRISVTLTCLHAFEGPVSVGLTQ